MRRGTSEAERRAFRARLLRLLDERDMSVRDFATAVYDGDETHDRTAYSWLSDKRVPSLGGLLRIRRALGCTWEELMGE